jgi:hypothetical protein
MSEITWPKSTLLTCSEDVAARLLGCTTSEIFRKENTGLLTHVPFWKDHGLKTTRSIFLRDYWQDYDVRHYRVDEVLALMPANSEMASHLKTLKRRNRGLMAGQIALGSLLPYLWVKISPSGSVSNAAPAGRIARPRKSPARESAIEVGSAR